MSTDNGGAAFPDNYRNEGMTLRDWFAGQALSGFLSCGTIKNPENVPLAAYSYADGMIAEKRRTEKEG